MKKLRILQVLSFALILLGLASTNSVMASEADLVLPSLSGSFSLLGFELTGYGVLNIGMVVCVLGLVFGLVEFLRIKALPAHKSMLDVSHLIYETCKSYLFEQGKMLLILEVFIGACIFYYF